MAKEGTMAGEVLLLSKDALWQVSYPAKYLICKMILPIKNISYARVPYQACKPHLTSTLLS